MKKIVFVIFALVAGLILFQNQVLAQDSRPEETLEGSVIAVLEEKQISEDGQSWTYQKLKILVKKGSLMGQEIMVENGLFPTAKNEVYHQGDLLVISYTKDLGNQDIFYISDYVRRDALLILSVIFVIVSVVVTRIWGVTSLFGMGFSFLVIFTFILPLIIRGFNPVLIAVLGSAMIIPVTFYLSHGFNKKTHVAIIGTIIALVITGLLATLFVDLARLTGFASEEAGFLQFEKAGLNMKGILLAGIIIGTLGVLDDVTVSQSAVVFQLKKTKEKLKFSELYAKAMKVGHDHITSMTNTLVLVYAGASMPLLLLFINNPRPILEVVNYELIADEIVRTLVGSIGLVLAVPITTFLATLYIDKKLKVF
jgi:uncharacterized membrane protein